MFIFLLALGEDYNILVMTRIREEARRWPSAGQADDQDRHRDHPGQVAVGDAVHVVEGGRLAADARVGRADAAGHPGGPGPDRRHRVQRRRAGRVAGFQPAACSLGALAGRKLALLPWVTLASEGRKCGIRPAATSYATTMNQRKRTEKEPIPGRPCRYAPRKGTDGGLSEH